MSELVNLTRFGCNMSRGPMLVLIQYKIEPEMLIHVYDELRVGNIYLINIRFVRLNHPVFKKQPDIFLYPVNCCSHFTNIVSITI